MDLKLEKAQKKHCDLLYKWVNDEIVRKNSFNTDLISYKQHKDWFENKLNSENVLVYIAYDNDNIPVGQIRLDLDGSIGLIDFSVESQYRGKSYGGKLLEKIKLRIVKDNDNIKQLVGLVKYQNIASQKSFEKAGFESLKRENFMEYYFMIKED